MSNSKPFISVIIAALNEEEAITNVVTAVPKDLADEIVVVDNGSKDRTAENAKAAGARVVREPIPGYGRAFRGDYAQSRPGARSWFFSMAMVVIVPK